MGAISPVWRREHQGGAMNAASVREALERILASPGFEASARHRRLLEYLVEETLAGRADRLKGLTIAIDVFGRDAATYDREADPVVRIEAAKLRRRLKSYYLTAGQEDPIRIDIPKGTYVPTFERAGRPSLDLPAPAGEPCRGGGCAPSVPGARQTALVLAHDRPPRRFRCSGRWDGSARTCSLPDCGPATAGTPRPRCLGVPRSPCCPSSI